MWSRICLSGETFAFCVRPCEEQNTFLVMMFDSKNLWSEELSKHNFTRRCNEYNPTLEFSENSTFSLINKTLSLLADESDDVKKIINTNDLNLRIISVETKLGGVPFKFHLHLKLVQNVATVHKEVTESLFLYIHDLVTKQQNLIDVIKKKDIEINEYKMQGAQLSRKNAATRVFNEEQFLNDYQTNFAFECDTLSSFINATKLSSTLEVESTLNDKSPMCAVVSSQRCLAQCAVYESGSVHLLLVGCQDQMVNTEINADVPVLNNGVDKVPSASSQELKLNANRAIPDPSQVAAASGTSPEVKEKTSVEEKASLERDLDESHVVKKKKLKKNVSKKNTLNL